MLIRWLVTSGTYKFGAETTTRAIVAPARAVGQKCPRMQVFMANT